jgi:hypothetical protein
MTASSFDQCVGVLIQGQSQHSSYLHNTAKSDSTRRCTAQSCWLPSPLTHWTALACPGGSTVPVLLPCGVQLCAVPTYAAVDAAHCAAAGTIEHANFMTPWQHLPETIYARPLVRPGDKVGALNAAFHQCVGTALWQPMDCSWGDTTEHHIK